MVPGNEEKIITGDQTLDDEIISAGYNYDSKQDIFISDMNAWQREAGYCRLYDEWTAPLGMIIDCEPIYFEYGGKRWLIEFWKGQYGVATGCEIGVYLSDRPDIDIPHIFRGTFFDCASDDDMLEIFYSLNKNGGELFTRREIHWWLTGFRLGEFSEPSQLKMNLSITLKDGDMLDAFLKGLRSTGYSENEITINGNTVDLEFDKPRTPQPSSRTTVSDWIIQRKNELMCNRYYEITKPYNKLPDKLKAVQKQAPELYKQIENIGKAQQLFKLFENIKKHLD